MTSHLSEEPTGRTRRDTSTGGTAVVDSLQCLTTADQLLHAMIRPIDAGGHRRAAGGRPGNGARHGSASAAGDVSGGAGHDRGSGWWPKACACLIRLALEAGLDTFWRQTNTPQVADCGSRRAKLIMLRHRTTRDTARRAAFAWAALSQATHHHCYDLPPTAAELRHLHTEVTAVLGQL